MERIGDGGGRYRVLLLGIGANTEEKKDAFCRKVYEVHGIPFSFLKKITERFPAILKKDLAFDEAFALAQTLKALGAMTSVEKWRNSSAISLEFQPLGPHRLTLESSCLRQNSSGVWTVIGRARNVSEEDLDDLWVLAQAFDDDDEILSFQEAPLPVNPLPSNGASPFKVLFEENLPVKRVSLTFKNAAGFAVPAIDLREKKDWVEVKWEEEDLIETSETPPSQCPSPMAEEASLDAAEEKPSFSPHEELPGTPLPPLAESAFPETALESGAPVETETPLPMTEDIEKMMALSGEKTSGDRSPLSHEESQPEKKPELFPMDEDRASGFEMIDIQEKKEEKKKKFFDDEPTPFLSISLPDVKDATEHPRNMVNRGVSIAQGKEVLQEAHFDISIFEEASKLLEEISREPVKQRREDPPLFGWIDDFRNSVKHYYQTTNKELFPEWFDSCRHSEGLDDLYRAVLTILAQARFHQGSPPEKSMENTQRVFRLLHEPNLSLDRIPPLEGTSFSSAENWRELFHRAIPKLQQVASHIIEQKRWGVPELERFIQIIPHMGSRNSRLAIQWIHELIPDAIEIDSSTIPVSVEENLYRVGARLGVVDPHFDVYQGRHSIADVKIQTFARMAFPQSPWKIEKPMTWVAKGREEGGAGHCLPTQPQCEGCLFETFCAKVYLDFNPSEKGMKAP